jgi:hypothetical protein
LRDEHRINMERIKSVAQLGDSGRDLVEVDSLLLTISLKDEHGKAPWALNGLEEVEEVSSLN